MIRNEIEDEMLESIDFKKRAQTMSQEEKDSLEHEEFLKSLKLEIYSSIDAEKRWNKLKSNWRKKNNL